jgi:hypothetical protein
MRSLQASDELRCHDPEYGYQHADPRHMGGLQGRNGGHRHHVSYLPFIVYP